MSSKYSVKNIFIRGLIVVLFIFAFPSLFAQQGQGEQEENYAHKAEVTEAEFQAGEMIIEEITDAYEWHIISIGHTHITIPLPLILYDEGRWLVFMSGKLHHGQESYKGYFISHEGFNAGKLVKKDDRGHEVRPTLDISITKNVLAIFFSLTLMIIIFVSVARAYKKREGHAPKGLQSFFEPIIIFVRDDIAKASIGEKKYEKFLPFLLTVFFFILFNNLLGIIPLFPGGANVTGNIGVTGVLAAFTFMVITFSGNKAYWTHIVNMPGVPWWLKIPVPLMPIVELMGLFTKPFVLMVRLFANISAGHIIILGFISLIFIFGQISTGLGFGVSIISVGFSVFMGFLELLVAFIQAYVFTLLSALYFGMATEEHH